MITYTILKEALETLDCLGIFLRENGIKPMLLVDGHGSRFQLPFLEYINNVDHKWLCCIGVPYGLALWQMGDSKEQNASFNIAMTKAKKKLMALKESKQSMP